MLFFRLSLRHKTPLLLLILGAFYLSPINANEVRDEDDFSFTPERIEEPPRKLTAIPRAKNIDLGEPVVDKTASPEDKTATEEALDPIIAPPDGSESVQASSLVLLGKEVQPGTTTRLSWSPSQSFEGLATPTPVLVAHGSQPGPVLCLTAAVHGDELNGIEIVRRVLHSLQAEKLWGTVIGVPIVNLQGFHRASRYLTDRRDLNRYFPGNLTGSSASRIAYSFFNQVIKDCDALVDLHTGSFYRTNLPQLRADLSKPEIVELTHGFGATVVLHSKGAPGTLRYAAVRAGIPAVTLEAGGPMQLQEIAVNHGVKGIQSLLNKLGMYKRVSFWGDPEPVYYQSTWVRSNEGGILFSEVKLGEQVEKGQLLGVVTDPITNVKSKLISPNAGRVLGMAINQVVQPGFAAFRIGIQKPDEQLVPESEEDNDEPDPPPEEEPDLASLDEQPDPVSGEDSE